MCLCGGGVKRKEFKRSFRTELSSLSECAGGQAVSVNKADGHLGSVNIRTLRIKIK